MSGDNMKIEVEGLKEFDELLGRLPAKLEKKYLKKIVRDAIRKALPAMKAAAPVDVDPPQSKWSKLYGRLKANLKVRPTKARKGSAGAGITSGDSFWGYFIENGTRFMPARPWFVKTFEAEAPKIIEHVEATAAEALKNEWKIK